MKKQFSEEQVDESTGEILKVEVQRQEWKSGTSVGWVTNPDTDSGSDLDNDYVWPIWPDPVTGEFGFTERCRTAVDGTP